MSNFIYIYCGKCGRSENGGNATGYKPAIHSQITKCRCLCESVAWHCHVVALLSPVVIRLLARSRGNSIRLSRHMIPITSQLLSGVRSFKTTYSKSRVNYGTALKLL